MQWHCRLSSFLNRQRYEEGFILNLLFKSVAVVRIPSLTRWLWYRFHFSSVLDISLQSFQIFTGLISLGVTMLFYCHVKNVLINEKMIKLKESFHVVQSEMWTICTFILNTIFSWYKCVSFPIADTEGHARWSSEPEWDGLSNMSLRTPVIPYRLLGRKSPGTFFAGL